MRTVLIFLLMIFTLVSFNPALAEEPRVVIFSPQGTVKNVRQVRVKFSEQMVFFGDPTLENPFEIKCPMEGMGRWADGKNWVYDFRKDLPAGVVCSFTLVPGLRTLSGKEVTGQRMFSFSTGGPKVWRSYPYKGSYVDENQIFILTLDAEPEEETVLANVTFSVEGINESISVRVLKGEKREQILEIYHERYRFRRYEDRPEIVLQCRQSFPNEKAVHLIWGKGVESVSGVPTTEDQVLHFKSRSPFTATFSCQRENPEAGCIPFLPMHIRFSSPVPLEFARAVRIKGGGEVYTPIERDEEKEKFVWGVTFSGPFPENTSFLVEIPPDIRDDAGRSLSNIDKFPLEARTGSYPPLAKFSARFGIIEKQDPVLPVTLRNIEPEIQARLLKVAGEKGIKEVFESLKGKILRVDEDNEIITWLREVASAGRSRSVLKKNTEAENFIIPKPHGKKAFEVVGIPLKRTGLYVVEIESSILGASLLGKHHPIYVPTVALVTNLSAHFKWGRESSLIWVTTLDNAEPVEGAVVTVRNCKGETLWEGTTDEKGIAYIGDELPRQGELPFCPCKRDREAYLDYSQLTALDGIDRELIITARTSDDLTFVHSTWDQGIEPWRFRLPEGSYKGPVIAHTVLGRSLLRAGETIHMKHIIRKHAMEDFSLLRVEELPKAVAIQHRGSHQSYEFPLTWDVENGVAETTWQVPVEAKLGHYDVMLIKKQIKKKKSRMHYNWLDYWRSGTFRVEEFRVPLMRGIIQPPSGPLVKVGDMDVDLLVTYLAGGGAVGLPVKLRSRVEPKHVFFTDYDGFTFANGLVKEGVLKRYRREERKQKSLRTFDLTLGSGGSARAKIQDIPEALIPQNVLMELEFRDPNGEVQTVSQRVTVWPSNILLGIKPDSWALSKEAFKFHVVALDVLGKPVPGVEVKVDIFKQTTFSHRKRIVGGFYAYEHVSETKRIGSLYEGITDAKGILICEVESPVSGNIILQAMANDSEGRIAVTNRSVWIAGKEDWWFDVSDSDRIDVLSEKKRYEPGETAKFQVRMPFREATALVTIEREGVMETHLRTLSGKQPVIELPVKDHYAPNVFVSVLCVRGRVGGVKPTALIDLGKPAYKLGIAEIKVGWQAHELKVDVKAERQVYKIREKARVKIMVKRADGMPLAQGAEVAVAAVDEGLLELMPNRSWDLLEDMMRRRGYEVRTSTAQTQVVGKRHYGLKALPQGGGGGRQRTREMFDTLLFWKGRHSLDRNGEATVEIPLLDSLTSFRIVAVATSGAGLFGTGQTSIRTTQDIMLLSGLPELVRQGDKFRAGFTLRNASAESMDVDIKAAVNGEPLNAMRVSLKPGESKEIGWLYEAPKNGTNLIWEVTAEDEKTGALDALKVKQRVIPATPVRVFQATLMQLEKSIDVAIRQPEDAEKERGGVRVYFRPKLSDEKSGIIDYMKDYPYTCIEQKVSVAVALRDKKRWKRIMEDLPSFLDSEGLVKYFPTNVKGSDVLTTYLLSIAHEAGWEIPAGSRSRMLKGLIGFVEGRVQRYSSLPSADLSIRKMAAVEALSRYGKAHWRHLHSIAIEPNLWPTSAVIDWLNVLIRIKGIPERKKKLEEAEQILKSRLNFQGTTLGFSTEKTDELWWLMCSVDVNAVRMLLSVLEFDSWREDMPRLLKGAMGRQRRGRWSTTVANAWGVLALEKFSEKFEAEPVEGISTAVLKEKKKGLDWVEFPEGQSIMFPWPEEEEKLNVSHDGGGRPWVVVQSLAAIPLTESFSSGYTFTKAYLPVERQEAGRWSRGDVVRVRIEIEAQADRTWVVVSDPIPAGATIIGTGLGRDSRLLTRGEKSPGWRWWGVWPAFKERSFEAFRAYYEYVPKGEWTVEYTMRLNTEGIFKLPETRVEALYSPEMFGEVPNEEFRIFP